VSELSQPPEKPIPWTFRTPAEGPKLLQPHITDYPNIVVIFQKVTSWRQTTVLDRFAFPARQKAALILGVSPESLELVK